MKPKRQPDRLDTTTLYSPGVVARLEAEQAKREQERIARRLDPEDLPEPPEAA